MVFTLYYVVFVMFYYSSWVVIIAIRQSVIQGVPKQLANFVRVQLRYFIDPLFYKMSLPNSKFFSAKHFSFNMVALYYQMSTHLFFFFWLGVREYFQVLTSPFVPHKRLVSFHFIVFI